MKTTTSTMARHIAGWITNNLLPVVVACLLASTGFCRAQDAPDDLPGPDYTILAASTNAAPEVDTNSPVAAIAVDLLLLKVRIEDAVAVMSNAVASTPAQQVAKVTVLADEITALATNELADDGLIVKQAEALVVKLNDSVATARQGSSDPNLGPAVREVYSQLLPRLEAELSKLIDAKSTVVRIRGELLRQAEGLRESAAAIGFAEQCHQLVLASQAFRTTLTEVVKFTEKISLLIQSVGKNAGLAAT